MVDWSWGGWLLMTITMVAFWATVAWVVVAAVELSFETRPAGKAVLASNGELRAGQRLRDVEIPEELLCVWITCPGSPQQPFGLTSQMIQTSTAGYRTNRRHHISLVADGSRLGRERCRQTSRSASRWTWSFPRAQLRSRNASAPYPSDTRANRTPSWGCRRSSPCPDALLGGAGCAVGHRAASAIR